MGKELICMTVESFHFGGCELQLLSQLKALRERGIHVIVLHSQAKAPGKFSPEGYDQFFYIPQIFRKLRLMRFYLEWFFRWKLNRYPTVLHCHGISYYSEQFFWFAERKKIGTLLKVTTEGEVNQLKEKILSRPTFLALLKILMSKKKWGEKRLKLEAFLFGKNRLKTYLNTDGFLTLNENIRHELEEFSVEKGKIIPIHNGVDTNRFKPISEEMKKTLKKELNLPSDKKFITTMSRFAKTKRIDDLIFAWSKLSDRFPDYQLLLVGGGPEKERYQELIRDLQIENRVIFTGFQLESEKYLQVSDIFAFPSELEGLSNALLEAMSSALPIAASSILSVRVLIEPFQNGLLFPTGDIEALAKSLTYLLENPREAEKMGLAAREKAVGSFSLQTLMPKMISLYEEHSRPFC